VLENKRYTIKNNLFLHCKVANKIKEQLGLFGREVFLAAKINETANTSQEWKNKIRFLTSTSRLHESLIKEQMPTLQEVTAKSVYSIYSNLSIQFLEYPPTIITYLNRRTRQMNARSIGKYRRLMEVLGFER
jgi:hypothetical protein